jgi:hypothetical protein
VDVVLLTTFWEVVAWLVMAAFWVLALAIFVWAFTDILRRPDLAGLGKAGWVFLVFVVPLMGPLIYIVFRPKSASYERQGVVDWAPQPGSHMSPAQEIAYAKQLLDQGTITRAEFEDVKSKVI